MRRHISAPAAICFTFWTGIAAAYNPPVDTVGDVTVRIEAPETVTQTDVPLPVRVLIENRGDKPVGGTLLVKVIDRWQVEPAGEVKFRATANGTAAAEFKITAGADTYSAHYPIHAYARFEIDGKPQTAHPIFILETKLPKAPRPSPVLEWKPVQVRADSELDLRQLPVRRAVVHVFKDQPLTTPTGWAGDETPSRASLRLDDVSLGGVRRPVVAMHPPWFEGRVGTMLVEYPLQLPQSKRIVLKFANAVTPDGKGDGVTFRVRAVPLDAPAGEFGKVLFERHSAAKTWQDAEADLSSLAGQAVRLQLESHPGPKNDTSFDQSYWAEPTLVAGIPPAPLPFPPKDNAGSRILGQSAAKPQAAPYEVRVWPGRRGLLDAAVGFTQGDKRLCFRGFEVRVLGGRIDDARSPILLLEAKEEPCPGGYQVRHRFQSYSAKRGQNSFLPGNAESGATRADPAEKSSDPFLPGTFDLVGRLTVEQGALRAKFALENAPPPKPWSVVYLEDVAAGPWSHTAAQVYAGHGNVVRQPEAFNIEYEGHRLATSFVGMDFADAFSIVQAVDVPPERFEVQPANRHYSFHAPHAPTFTFVPSQNAFEAVKHWRTINGLKKAGGVDRLAGRFVFDVWGGRYGESHEALQRAFRYGLTDAMVIWHNWQRWGYDYRLPEINPPNPQFGTQAELAAMIAACKKAGVLFALHDNYIDFYPDAEGFSYERQIAFDRRGEPVKAWLNEGRGARSYRFRADTIAPFLQANVQWIAEHLKCDAYFIDVWSSIAPYDYWTADGRFFDRIFTRKDWGEQFAWIRRTLGNDAPQISESGHDQLIGWLDGGTANHLRVGTPLPGYYNWSVIPWKCGDAERTPWFDAAHHDRFILHGAGYSGRYEGGLEPRMHGIFSDDYITTEVLTGHPAMVPHPFDRNVVRKYWLLHDPMRALALQQIERVEYIGGDLHRQHVAWRNGDVWVNRGTTDWNVAGYVLPQYGFYARVRPPQAAGLSSRRGKDEKNYAEAGIEQRDGTIVEWCRTPTMLYVNGRQPADGPLAIAAEVQACKHTGGRNFEMPLVWRAGEPIPPEYRSFLHFVDAKGEILFQAGHNGEALTKPGETIATTARFTVPESLKPGETNELRMGFYKPGDGHRLAIAGPDDGTHRIRLGSIRLEGEGGKLTGATWTPHKAEPDPFLARQNPAGKPVDFGGIVTAGGCRVSLDGNNLLVTPLPSTRGPKFGVRLLPAALPWKLPEPTHVETLDESGKVLARRPLRRDGAAVLLDCEPGTFAYRLVREQ